MITICMATSLEAQPFIDGLAMTSLALKPFRIFTLAQTNLIVTGIGKANAAMATAYAIQKLKPERVYNLGAAGAVRRDLELGEVRQISQAIEPDRPHLISGKPYIHYPDQIEGLQTARLATHDRPILESEARRKIASMADLVDMEGAAVIQTCRKFNVSCVLVKFISDTTVQAKDADIVASIRSLRQPFFDEIKHHLPLGS